LVLPLVLPEIQRQLFRVGLEYLAGRANLINRVIEIDLHKEKVAKKQTDDDSKGVISRYSGQKPAFRALFATKLLPNPLTV
jgi:hypothetical protein